MEEFIPNQLETAEERATRMWRNNHIVKSIQQPETISQQPLTIAQSDVSLARLKRMFRKEILSVFEGHQAEIIAKYKASIAHYRRRLMIEKLRRLERDK
jgi:hypothetical protein